MAPTPSHAQVAPSCSWLERAAFVVLLGHLLLCPLLFSHDTLEPFEFPKTRLLLLNALLLAGLGVSHRLWTRGPRLSEHKYDLLTLGILLFLASAGLSTALSLSPRLSLVGDHESYAGLETVTAYGLLFFAARHLGGPGENTRRLLAGALLAGVGVTAHAVLQAFHLDPITWDNVSHIGVIDRPFASLGHANHLGAYLVMTLPLTVYFLRDSIRQRRWGSVIPLALLGLLQTLGVVVTLSRGAWLAGSVLLLFLLVVALCRGRRTFLGVGAATVVLIAVGVTILRHQITHPVQGALQRRVEALTHVGGRSAHWSAAWEMFKAHPLTGAGLDAFRLAFAPHRPLELAKHDWGTTPTRAHNELLHVLATQGLIGGLALGVLLLGVLASARRVWHQRGTPTGSLGLALLASLLGGTITLMVSFSVTGITGLLVVILGLLSRLTEPRTETVEEAPLLSLSSFRVALAILMLLALGLITREFTGAHLENDPSPWLATGIVGSALLGGAATLLRLSSRDPAAVVAPILPRSWPRLLVQGGIVATVCAVLILRVLQPYRAAQACCAGEREVGSNDRRALQHYHRATQLAPREPIYWTRLGAGACLLAENTGDLEARKALLSESVQAMEQALALEPRDPQGNAHLAHVLGRQAQLVPSVADRASEQIEAAIEADPRNALFLIQAGRLGLTLGRPALTRKYAGLAHLLYPDAAQPTALLAMLAWLEGEHPLALRLAEEAEHSRWNGDGDAELDFTEWVAYMDLQSGKMWEAFVHAYHASTVRPQRVAPQVILGRLAELRRDWHWARHHYQRVLQLAPQHPVASEGLTRVTAQIESH